MELEYEVIEDAFDDTTHIRTMTEQAPVPGGGWLIRTTLYTPHHLTVDVTFVRQQERGDKANKRGLAAAIWTKHAEYLAALDRK